MIIKENLNPVPLDKFEKAGYEAERKVAYYLKMTFGDDAKLLILHDLRVEFEDGITAQMDHLIIHEHGLIIVESKSVAGKLQVQDDGQWIRWYSQKGGKDSSIGMENPIKQASRQGQTLKKVLLSGASNDVTRKAIQDLPVDVLVTFSTTNGGVFIAKNRQLYPEVCPADVVDDHVNRIVFDRAINAKPQDFRLSESHRTKLAEHLVKIHQPYKATHLVHEKPYLKLIALGKPSKVEQKISEYIAIEKPKPTSVLGVIAGALSSAFFTPNSNFKHACRQCKSEKLEALSGRFGYYFKCLNCKENTTIKTSCHICKNILKIRKDKKQFFAECSTCNTSELFHLNS